MRLPKRAFSLKAVAGGLNPQPAPTPKPARAQTEAGMAMRVRFPRSFMAVSMFTVLSMTLSACFGGGGATGVSLKEIPVDLVFGAAEKFKPKPQVAPPKIPQFNIPDFTFKPRQGIGFELPPPKPCTLRKNSPDEEAGLFVRWHPQPGDYLYASEATLPDGKVIKENKYRKIFGLTDLIQPFPQRGAVEPGLNQESPLKPGVSVVDNARVNNGRPPLNLFTIFDGLTGTRLRLRWVPDAFSSSTETTLDGNGAGAATHPDRGLHMDYIIWPKKLGDDKYDKYTFQEEEHKLYNEMAKQYPELVKLTEPVPPQIRAFTPVFPDNPVALDDAIYQAALPRTRLLEFPVEEGRVTLSIGYDALNGKWITSRTVVTAKETVRVCDDLAASWKVHWTMVIGSQPDLPLALQGQCGGANFVAAMENIKRAVGAQKPVRLAADLLRGQVNSLFSLLPSSLENTRAALIRQIDAAEEVAQKQADDSGLPSNGADLVPYLDQAAKAFLGVCSTQDLGPAFDKMREANDIRHFLDGDFWFVPQFGGWIVKDDYQLRSDPAYGFSGHFKSNSLMLKPE